MTKRIETLGTAIIEAMIRGAGLGFTTPVIEAALNLRRSETDLDKQVRDAFEALSKSSDLIENLSDVLKERETRLNELQAEYARISQLSSLTSEQADAVAMSLENVLGKSAAKERIYAFAINIGAGVLIFFLGIVAADRIKHLFGIP